MSIKTKTLEELNSYAEKLTIKQMSHYDSGYGEDRDVQRILNAIKNKKYKGKNTAKAKLRDGIIEKFAHAGNITSNKITAPLRCTIHKIKEEGKKLIANVAKKDSDLVKFMNETLDEASKLDTRIVKLQESKEKLSREDPELEEAKSDLKTIRNTYIMTASTMMKEDMISYVQDDIEDLKEKIKIQRGPTTQQRSEAKLEQLRKIEEGIKGRVSPLYDDNLDQIYYVNNFYYNVNGIHDKTERAHKRFLERTGLGVQSK